MITLDKLIRENLEGKKRLTERIINRPDSVSNNVYLNLWFCEESFAINFLSSNNLNEARNVFYTCSLLDEFRLKKYNDRFLDYGLQNISYALLSDNEELIQKYAQLRYQKGKNAELSMDEMVAQGESAIWCNTVQFFMTNDIKGVERNLNIIETLTLPKLPKNQQELKLDYKFYKALLSKDKSKCEELLEQLLSPKIHKKRNDNTVLAQYVSQPALGYAKLAWRQGIKVEVNSPLIPKEILPIEPLDNYEIPYNFLKDAIS